MQMNLVESVTLWVDSRNPGCTVLAELLQHCYSYAQLHILSSILMANQAVFLESMKPKTVKNRNIGKETSRILFYFAEMNTNDRVGLLQLVLIKATS